MTSRSTASNSYLRPISPASHKTPPTRPTASKIPKIRLTHATPSSSSIHHDETLLSPNSAASISIDSIPQKPRLVTKKKSKLSLLTGSRREKDSDFSDITRRLGMPSSAGTSAGYEIRVDPMADPDIGEIVVVKKEKPRAKLEGIRWVMGEKTNTNDNEKVKEKGDKKKKEKEKENVKPKAEEKEKDKWWTIGRGRRLSKEKEKDKSRAKSPGPSMITGLPTPPPSATRPDIHRLNSADSVVLPDNKSHRSVKLSALSRPNTPALHSPPSRAGTPSPNTLQPPPSRAGTPSPALVVPMPDEDACKEKDGKGSLAIRAMKSFARIGSWAQLKNSSGPSDKEGRRKKGSSDSASSWEAGDYTMARSILSPAVDGTFRSRLSAKSSGGDSSASSNHLSAESAYNGVGLGWPGGAKRLSTLSTASSLAPVSTYSRSGSKGSTCSSSGDWHTGRLSVQSEASNPPPAAPILARTLSTDAAVQRPPKSSTRSIRWDENLNSNLETIKEKRRGAKERRGGTTVAAPLTPTPDALPSTQQISPQSGKSPEGLQRGRLSDLFPDVVQSTRASVIERVVTGSEDEDDSIKRVVVESATSESECSTPPRVRARPMSENLLGARPRAVAVPAKEGGDAAISILNAATSDLASLINRLDLQATPENGISPSAARSLFASRDSTAAFGTPHKVRLLPASPSRKSPKESPSITSLRPYNKAAAAKSKVDVNSTIRASVVSTDIDNTTGSHGPVFSLPGPADAIRFAPRSNVRMSVDSTACRVFSTSPIKEVAELPTPASSPVLTKSPTDSKPKLRVKRNLQRQQRGQQRNTVTTIIDSYAGAVDSDSASQSDNRSSISSEQMSLPPRIKTRAELRKELGTNGTFGDASDSDEAAKRDSEIPHELVGILSGDACDRAFLFPDDLDVQSIMEDVSPQGRALGSPSDLACGHNASRTVSPCPGAPPSIPLPEISPSKLGRPPAVPIFRAFLIDDAASAIGRPSAITGSEPASPRSVYNSDGDTKKTCTFDFTRELNRLNESGEGNRQSFIEQLEAAFQDPAKLDSFDFDRLIVDAESEDKHSAPAFDPQSFVKTLDFSLKPSMTTTAEGSNFEDMHAPPVFSPTLHSHVSSPDSAQQSVMSPLVMVEAPMLLDATPPSLLDDSQIAPSQNEDSSASYNYGVPLSRAGPMALSIDARLPQHIRQRSLSESVVEEDSSIMRSIYAHAISVPPVPPLPRRRVASDTSSKKVARASAGNSVEHSHIRSTSGVSFVGFESFSMVRNRFEFPDERPSYFESDESSRGKKHAKHESVYTLASVSSYGQVIKGGVADPFNYHYQSRPPSEDLSQAVNDTFSFLNDDPHQRRQSMASDISSFYFHQGYRKGHRNRDSVLSVSSVNGPPVSMYNRSHGQSFTHNRSDSITSGSSLAHAYSNQGAEGGRAAWARHYRESSVDITADFSVKRLGRPGLGDKMLQSTRDSSIPLTAISASPPESARCEQAGEHTSYDSLLDEERGPSVDSIFDKTGNRTSVSSDSIFGVDPYRRRNLKPVNQFRPISMLSSGSGESRKDDDTMLTMLNGEHVRRKSIGSSFEASPCIRMEKHRGLDRPVSHHPPLDESLEDSFGDARIDNAPLVHLPSVKFGPSRMDKARQGLLERQSLENSCLIAGGEDVTASFGSAIEAIISEPSPTQPAPRLRPTSLTSESSGSATPPLCQSDSGGSQSSIDMAHLDAVLTSATRPTATTGRLRARGQGHRRRQSQISRSSAFSSIIDSIQAEPIIAAQPPAPAMMSFGADFDSLTASEKEALENSDSIVMIVDGDDDETGPILRRYWALRSEADETLAKSKIVWQDTPFSMFALQTFMPPHEPSAMKAMLEHSQTSYGPLPLELRVRRTRSRTNSRPSPYPQRFRSSPQQLEANPTPRQLKVLSTVPVDLNSPTPAAKAVKPLSPLHISKKANRDEGDTTKGSLRQRKGSGARRAALGWSKRKTPKPSEKSFANKENNISLIMSPTESLRLSRPRPRGRVR